MLDKAFQVILQQQALIPPRSRVLVGLSGGGDSVALLHLLLQAAPAGEFALEAAHLDHALRPESAAEAERVAELCRRWQVPLHTERRPVRPYARQYGLGLEEAARLVRREYLQELAARHHCQLIALGHHCDDQAETVLHRLLRGSGASGLAAMRLCSGPFIRPLLPFSRRQLQRYLLALQLEYLEDPSNRDPAFTRNRIRHQLLPQLEEWQPGVGRRLAGLAERLALEEDYWEEQVATQLQRLARPQGEGLEFACDALLALHPALRTRLLRGALARVRGDLQGIGARHLAALEGLLQASRPQAELHLPRLWAARRYTQLWLCPHPPAPAADWQLAIPGPGCYSLPDGRQLQVELAAASGRETPEQVEFALPEPCFPLLLRTVRPGDRFRPAGVGGSQKLKKFFIDHKLPREQRQSLPLLVGPEILWLLGVRRCSDYRPAGPGETVLRLTLRRAETPTMSL